MKTAIFIIVISLNPNTSDIIQAQSLIVTGNNMPLSIIQQYADKNPKLAIATKQEAIKNEIIDKKEKYYFCKITEFATDVQLVSRIYHETKDLPDLSLSNLLPNKEYCSQAIEFNNKYQSHLKKRWQWDVVNRNKIEEILLETEYLNKLYNNMLDSQRSFLYNRYRKESLKRVINEIGYEGIYNQIIPPCVPTWQFPEE